MFMFKVMLRMLKRYCTPECNFIFTIENMTDKKTTSQNQIKSLDQKL